MVLVVLFFPKPKPGRFGDQRSVHFGFVTWRDYAGRRRETTPKDFCLETGEDALSYVVSVNQRRLAVSVIAALRRDKEILYGFCVLALENSAAPPGLEMFLTFNPRLKPWAIFGRFSKASISVNS